MANTKITSLDELTATPATNDVIPVVDVSDTTQASSGTTKKLQMHRLMLQNGGSATLQGSNAFYKSEHPSGTVGSFEFGFTSWSNAPTIAANIDYTGSGDPLTNSVFTTPNKYGGMIRLRGDVGGWQFFDGGQSTGFGSVVTFVNVGFLRKDVCWFSPRANSNDLSIGTAGFVGIGVSGNSAGNKLEVVGTIQTDGLRIDQTPTSGAVTSTHYFTINLNGTNYRIPCGIA